MTDHRIHNAICHLNGLLNNGGATVHGPWLAETIAQLEGMKAEALSLRKKLEAVVEKYNRVISDRQYIVGWNDGFSYAETADETRDIPDVVGALCKYREAEIRADERAKVIAETVALCNRPTAAPGEHDDSFISEACAAALHTPASKAIADLDAQEVPK